MDKEQRLIAGCKRGESWAFREVYENYSSSMMSLCVRYVADKEQAKDVLQEGFIKIFTKINQYEGRGSFSSWVKQIFIHTALEYLSKNELLQSNIAVESFSTLNEDFDIQLVEQLSAEDLLECIGELSPRVRTVFNLYAIEGYNHAEIAEKLDIKENSSRAFFSKARKSLQMSVLKLMNK